jgi:hypothetical protein
MLEIFIETATSARRGAPHALARFDEWTLALGAAALLVPARAKADDSANAPCHFAVNGIFNDALLDVFGQHNAKARNRPPNPNQMR